MSRSTNRMRLIRKKIDKNKQYCIYEAISLLKELSLSKFVESVDVAINLSINARKIEQNVRGTTILPYGTGRLVRVAVFAQGEEAKTAKAVGAELVGMDDLAEQIEKRKINFEIVIATPDAMYLVSKLGKILGPRGLMPNPKMGTVTQNISEIIKNVKSGQIYYRNDKNGIIHSTFGKINFESIQLKENLEALLLSLKKIKLTQIKKLCVKKISISTTMGVGIVIDQTSLNTTLN